MKSRLGNKDFEAQANVLRPILYDITRLVTRGLNPAPNGIDRIDFALARSFLSDPAGQNKAFIYTLLGPRLVPAYQAIKTVNLIEEYWDNISQEKIREELKVISERINSQDVRHKNRLLIKRRFGLENLKVNLYSLLNWALCRGDNLEFAPEGAVYLNVSQFLLDKEWFINELKINQNIKCVFYIHDLIASEYPEFFTQGEVVSFKKKIKNISRCGAGYITASQSVSRAFSTYLTSNQFDNLPACIYRPKVSDAFV